MRRLLLWSLVAGFTACLIRPTLATITPDYDYVDGCEPIVIQGNHLGINASAQIGTADVADLQPAAHDDKVPEYAQDIGFEYDGTAPPAPGGKSGFYDVVLTVDGEKLTIYKGFYYRTCPATFRVDAYSVPAAAGIGDTITLDGCGLTSDLTVQYLDDTQTEVATGALVSDCSSAHVHTLIPTLPSGTYTIVVLAGDGTASPLQTCLSESGDTGQTCIPDVVTVP